MSYLSRSLSVFHSVFSQRVLVKYIGVLTFHFPSLYGLCSRSSSWKSKDDAMFTLRRLFDSCQIERYLEPDIVLTRNWVGRGGDGSVSFWRSSLSTWTFASFFFKKAAIYAQESRCTVFAVPCGCQGGIHSIFGPRTPRPREEERSPHQA